MYTIVYFRDGLELVPTKWQTADNKCFYPPYCSRSRIEHAIKVMEDPEPFWKKYVIKRVFGTAATYERGINKLEAATRESEIETDFEVERRLQPYEDLNGAATKKQRRTFEIEDSSSDQEISVPKLKSPGFNSNPETPRRPQSTSSEGRDTDDGI